MNCKKLEKCAFGLEKLALFLNQHRSIYDVCMVDFITKDIFEKSIRNEAIKADLQNLTQQQIIELPSKMTQNINDDDKKKTRFLKSQ